RVHSAEACSSREHASRRFPWLWSLLVLRQELGQIGRERRLEDHPLTCRGMDELQMGGVEELARRQRQLRPAIDSITDDGMADRGQVDANLVGAARLELQLQQRASPRLAQDLEAGARLASAVDLADQRHPLAVAGIAANRRVNDALWRGHTTLHQRQIAFDGAMLL